MLRWLFRYDIEAFCHFFYPSITQYPFQNFHRKIFTWHIDDARNKRAVFIIPRRHAKTTVMRMLFVHNGCYRREPYNLNFCETQPQTMQMARAVKSDFDCNELLHEVYGKEISISENKHDPDQGALFKLANGTTFCFSSMGSATLGFGEQSQRPSFIVADECVAKEAITSSAERERGIIWIGNVLEFIGSNDANIVVTNTMVANDTIPDVLSRRPDFYVLRCRALVEWPKQTAMWDQWKEIYVDLDNKERLEQAIEFYAAHRAAMDDGAEVLWEENRAPGYPSKLYELMATRLNVGEGAFNRELQNEPSDPDRQKFNMAAAEYFELVNEGGKRYVKRNNGYHIPVDGVLRYGVLDTAGPPKQKNARSDYAAAAIVGRDDSSRLLALDAWVERTTTAKQVSRFLNMCSPSEWNVHSMIVKVTGTQGMTADVFRRELNERQKRGEWCDMVPRYIDETGNKIARIMDMQAYVENHWLIFNKALPYEAINQLRQFGTGGHDDYPDALEEGVRRMKSGPLN